MATRPTRQRAPRRGEDADSSDIGYLLKQLVSAFRRRLDEQLRGREVDLSMTHMATLYALQAEPGLAGAELARRRMVSAQAMSGVLRKLERDRLITRGRHPANRHTDRWTISAAGSRRLEMGRKVAEPVVQEMLSGLSHAEHRELRRLLTRCVATLEAPAELTSSVE